MNGARRIAALVLVPALLAIGAAGCGDDDGDTTGETTGATTTAASGGGYEREPAEPAVPAVPTIVVRDGKPVGEVEELEFSAGEQVRFNVRSNEADEVHVHGYDLEEAVPAGGTARFSFPADLEGIYEVELHHSGELIAELRVNP
jgi:hypothetical protein